MFKVKTQFKEDSSLAHQLFQYIFGLYCVIAILVTGIHIFEEYKFTKNSITKELETYQSIFSPILEQALWDLDREQIEVATEAIISVPIIVGIEIERYLGDKLQPYSSEYSSKIKKNSHEQFSYSFPIIYQSENNEQSLGKATFYSDTSIVLERLKLGFTFLIINALIKGIALWLIFWWVSKKLLIRPLNKLKDTITNLRYDNLGENKVDLGVQQQNELSIIETSFNKMLGELSHAKKAVSDFNSQLEKSVDLRTINLSIAKEQSEQAALTAESSNIAKSKFLIAMNHELRTPMGGIQGALYLLSQTDLDEKQLQYLNIADISSHKMLQLLNDIFDTIKLNSGDFILKNANFDLYSSLESLYESEKEKNNNSAIDIRLNADSIKNTVVHGDKEQVLKIFKYILSNALKFTETGQVLIDIQKEVITQKDSRLVRIYASISDSGAGISAIQIDTIFDSLLDSLIDGFEGNGTSSQEHKGTGLGLSICKNLCELMDGSISVTSQVGEGSIFTFDILLPLVEN